MEEILPSAEVYHYRNRLDFAFSEKEWLTSDKLQNKEYQIQPALGFHITGRFDKVLNIDECLLMQEPVNRIRNFVKSFALKEGYTFFNRISQQGDLRNMLVRNTTSEQWMVVMIFADADEEKRSKMLNAIKEEFPEITSLYYFINQKKNDTFFDLQPVLWSGAETITENMGGLKFTIHLKHFFKPILFRQLNCTIQHYHSQHYCRMSWFMIYTPEQVLLQILWPSNVKRF